MEVLEGFLNNDDNSTHPFSGLFKSHSPVIDSYPLMSSPWPTLAIVWVYLVFVLSAGPRMMKNRPPFSLRWLIASYNLILVVLSMLGVMKIYSMTAGKFFMVHCRRNTLDPETHEKFHFLAWIFFASKIVELFDTVFFVLRRKMNQVSFLHVYHHVNMLVFTWFYVKMIPSHQILIIGSINTFVHTIMYTYYFLSSFGPAIQPYLWWKKYLTTIQILQFVIVLIFFTALLITPGCEISKNVILLSISNTIPFLVLFVNFYIQAYLKKDKHQKTT